MFVANLAHPIIWNRMKHTYLNSKNMRYFFAPCVSTGNSILCTWIKEISVTKMIQQFIDEHKEDK